MHTCMLDDLPLRLRWRAKLPPQHKREIPLAL